ncbi:MlaD family protein [Kangiella sp. TOML190]|uniref:MlaD family protein n=1 Tax=Kangiella sp. TOML190 TaxID=2931351 RepID=UPI00203C40F3|nr:MlaD family protein [Kangiella sp. TOML190]
MSNKSQSTAIGGFVLGAIVLLVGAIFLFAKSQFSKDTEKIVLFFEESLSGLDVGAPVVFNGVKIGQVYNIEVLADVSNLDIYTPVYIEVYQDSFRQLNRLWSIDRAENTRKIIEKGLRATLQLQSLVTGKLQVALEFRPETPVQVKGIIKGMQEYPTAPNTFSILTSQLSKLPLEDIANNVNNLVVNLDHLLSKSELETVIQAVNETLAEYKKLASQVGQEIKPVSSGVKATMNDYQQLAQNINKRLPAMTESLQQAFERLNQVLLDTQKLIVSVENSYGDKSELRYQLNITLQEISKAAHSVKLLTDYLERHPEAFIYGKDQP